MKNIELSKGHYTQVDDEDYDELNKYKWYCNVQKSGKYIYAARRTFKASFHISMHKQIMGTNKNELIDHIDHDGLNNQKKNLRVCTKKDNVRSSRLASSNTSGYKGACWHKGANKWMASICVNQRHIYLGLYSDKIEAAKVYDEAAIKYFGEFAYTNFNYE